MTLADKYGNDGGDDINDILMCGFGVGLSWGVVSAKVNTEDILPIIKTDDYFTEGSVVND